MQGNNKYRADRLRGNPDPHTREEYSSPGTVISVFPDDYACRVRDDLKGAEYDVAVPGLIQDPEGCGGAVYIPKIGQRVELKFGGSSRPRISQCLSQTYDAGITSKETPSLFEQKQSDLNLFGKAPNNFRGYMPRGLTSGDWCRIGNLGQYVGVFEGGIAALHGSKWAQVRATGGQGADTLSLIGRRMNLHTDFGDIKFGSESGKSFVELLGGTDQTLESGVDRQNWTIKAGIGNGEGLANFAIMDRLGNPIYKTVIGADGTVSRTQTGDNVSVFTGDQSIAYERAFSRSVIDGNDTVTIADGDRIENYTGNQTTTISANREVSVLSDDSTIAGGNIFRSCKTYDLSVEGRLDAKPKDSAATWKVANGSLDIEIGKPPGDLNTASSSFNVTVYPAKGNISLQSLGGNVETFSTLETNIEAATKMSLSAGAALDVSSIGIATFGSSALVKLGSNSAAQPVLKGTAAISALNTFSAAVAAAAGGAGSIPFQNGAAITAIGVAAGALASSLSGWLSTKVMTE